MNDCSVEKSKENGLIAEKCQDRKSKMSSQKMKEERENGNQVSNSPGSPDRRGTADISGIPSPAPLSSATTTTSYTQTTSKHQTFKQQQQNPPKRDTDPEITQQPKTKL